MADIQERFNTVIKKLQDLDFELTNIPHESDRIDDAIGRLYRIRRDLEEAYNDFVKSGATVQVVTEGPEYVCPECSASTGNADSFYAHLRARHKLSDQEAADKTAEIQESYGKEISTLEELLAKHTEVLLEETNPFVDSGEDQPLPMSDL